MTKGFIAVAALGTGKIYALKDTAQAHRDLKGPKTTGSTVFTV